MTFKTLTIALAAFIFLLPIGLKAQETPVSGTIPDSENVVAEIAPAPTSEELASLLLSYLSAPTTQEQLPDTLTPTLLARAQKGYDLLTQAETILTFEDEQKERKAAILARFAKVEYLALLSLLTVEEKTFVLQEIVVRTQAIIDSIPEPEVVAPSNPLRWFLNLF